MAVPSDCIPFPVGEMRSFAEMERFILNVAEEECNRKRTLCENEVYLRITAHFEDWQLAYSPTSDLSSFDPLFFILLREEAKSGHDEARFLWLLLEQEQVEDVLGLSWPAMSLPQFEGKMFAFFDRLCQQPLFHSRTFFYNVLLAEREERRCSRIERKSAASAKSPPTESLAASEPDSSTAIIAPAPPGTAHSGASAGHSLASGADAATSSSSLAPKLDGRSRAATATAASRSKKAELRGGFMSALALLNQTIAVADPTVADLTVANEGGSGDGDAQSVKSKTDEQLLTEREAEIQKPSLNNLYSFLIEAVPLEDQRRMFYSKISPRLHNLHLFTQISPHLFFCRGVYGGISARP